MAGRTTAELTDLLDALRIEHAELRTQLGLLRAEYDRAEVQGVRERLAKIESLLALTDFGGLITRIATLEEQNVELKKWREESDRRRWQTILLFGGSLLTLAIQLTVLFLKK